MGIRTDIIDIIEAKRLKCYGQMRRMTEDRCPLKIWQWTPEQRRRVRLKRSWKDEVNVAITSRGLTDDDWKTIFLMGQRSRLSNTL